MKLSPIRNAAQMAYRPDGFAYDIGPAGYTLTANGIAVPYADSYAESAPSKSPWLNTPVLDGVDDYFSAGTIATGHPLQLTGTDFTIMCAFKRDLTAADGFQRIIDKSTAGNGAGGYSLYIDVTDSSLHFYADGGEAADTATSVSAAQWYVVSVEFEDGVGCKIYVDGTDATVINTGQTVPDTSAILNIGSWSSGSTRNFKGNVGPIMIVNRLVTTNERNWFGNMLQAGLAVDHDSVVAFWPMNGRS